MIEKVCSYIAKEIGLEAESLVLVALSGGADSTALLLIMKELGYKLEALHCNFHLRGEESNRDQAFVEELCKEQGVTLSVRHFNTEEVARERGISIEMAARDLRYDWFREELKARKAAYIAVAHHRDDQAETLLLNLIRGTGLRGLAGMQPKHDDIIRPLLCLSRKEILQYLESRGQSYVTDSTNLERTCQRNSIRLDLIPMLQSINPSAVEHLCLASDNVRESLAYYKKGIEAAFQELGITASTFPLNALTSHTLLHEWLAGKGFNQAQEEEMLMAGSSTSFNGSRVGKFWVSSSHKVLFDREALLLLPLNTSEKSVPQLKQEIVSCIGETGSNVAYFDADLLTEAIEVRAIREGDSFVPFGMKGRKLVSDFLTDRKLNRFEKAEQFVATCGEDIIWLIGHRSDNRYRVTDKTSRILKLSVLNCQT
ncbi:MAG: tRNA lysidine(34) synthetase TilS [Bacteroidaceae bacterium]|nr:tRNA lysidine(34) synthetase TilS [Bacteroidaceae bacterium]